MSYNFRVSPRILELLPKAIEHNKLLLISNYADTSCCCLIPPNAEYKLKVTEYKNGSVEGVINTGVDSYIRKYETEDDVVNHIFETTMSLMTDNKLRFFSRHLEQDKEVAAAVINKVFRDKVFCSEYSYYLSDFLYNSVVYRYVLHMVDQGSLQDMPDVKDIVLSYGKFVVDFKCPTESYLLYLSKLTFQKGN